MISDVCCIDPLWAHKGPILVKKLIILIKNHKIINKNIKIVNLEILKVKTWFGDKAVSYTHLTLPTILLV